MVKKYSNEDFESLLEQYDYNFKRGDIVKGVVCAYESDGAIVDIGSKCTAYVPAYEVSSDKKAKTEEVLEKGTEYEFLITSDCDENGKFLLSYKKVHLAHTWAELVKIKEADETIAVVVTQTVKGGLIVDVSGVQGFVPQGQLCSKEASCQVGDKIDVKILSLDKIQNNLILSNRKVYETNMAETRKNVFEQVEVGQIVKGEVVRITDFGAFVNIGGVDCLLPLSQISWKWVEHPTDLLKLGQEINVEIIDIDYNKQRISLSLKNPEPDPWIKAEEELRIEQEKNTYLRTSSRSLSEDAKGLVHNIKYTSSKISSSVDNLYELIRVDKISKSELLKKLGTIKFHAKRALKISKLITRANFRSEAQTQFVDVVSYIEQYLTIYQDISTDSGMTFILNNNDVHFKKKVSILDLSVILDDLISNAEKANATMFQVDSLLSNEGQLRLIVSDNGNGISERFANFPNKIFELGVTTTDGSGIGLFNVKNALKNMGGMISVLPNGTILKGAAFELVIK